MLDVALIAVLALACLGGALLTVVHLPGTWLIVAAAVGFGWYYDWQVLGPGTLLALAVIAVVAEAGEFLGGVWVANKAGASRRAAWCGLIGGLIGAVALTIPVPMVGTIIGAAVGCFAGALAAELSLQKTAADGMKIGLYAAAGQTLGIVLKIAAAVIMSGIAVVSAILHS